LQHTWQTAIQSKLAQRTIIATDSEEILRLVTSFGGEAILTLATHESGTDRLAEVATRFPEYELLVNVQGDEPEIAPTDIDLVINILGQNTDTEMATLATPIRDIKLLLDPSTVKVVFDQRQRALYFSRSPIPFPRDGMDNALQNHPDSHFQHIGIYVYRRNSLLKLTASPRSATEVCESLEQLRALHLGMSILVGIVPKAAKGIDTAEDYEAFVRRNSS
jgi:3-deoxy-manno-octulosonate cytidylyltransferase (CMP-KDO synthetase)